MCSTKGSEQDPPHSSLPFPFAHLLTTLLLSTYSLYFTYATRTAPTHALSLTKWISIYTPPLLDIKDS